MLLNVNLGTIAAGSYYEDATPELTAWSKVNYPRIIVQAAIDGSDAEECTLAFEVNSMEVALIKNIGTDGVITDSDMNKKIYAFVPANAQIRLLAGGVSAADAVWLMVQTVRAR